MASLENRGNGSWRVVISAGYDVLRSDADTIQDCIRRADARLYEDKARKQIRVK